MVVVEAGLVAGYVIAWVVRKARRAGDRLDAEADAAIDAGLDQLHEVVAAKLRGHPVLEELYEEAAVDGGQVSELTRQQVELAIASAAGKDEAFARSVTELVARLREVEQAAGRPAVAGAGSAVFTGDTYVQADHGSLAFGQVAGDVNLNQGLMDPSKPGRSGH